MQTFELIEKKTVTRSNCYTVSEYLYNKYKETCVSRIQEILFAYGNTTLRTDTIRSLIELSKKEAIFHIINQERRIHFRTAYGKVYIYLEEETITLEWEKQNGDQG
jgi:hypothetical protein